MEKIAAPCFSCADDDSVATHIAMAPHKDGGGKFAFAAPICSLHVPVAIIAGWNPIHPLNSPEGRKAWDEMGWRNPQQAVPIS